MPRVSHPTPTQLHNRCNPRNTDPVETEGDPQKNPKVKPTNRKEGEKHDLIAHTRKCKGKKKNLTCKIDASREEEKIRTELSAAIGKTDTKKKVPKRVERIESSQAHGIENKNNR